MAETKNPISVVDDALAWNLLRTEQVGRVVTNGRGVVDIFPLNFVVDGESIVIRTAEGTKLIEMIQGDEILFEADHWGTEIAWSVIIRGKARLLETPEEIAAAELLPLNPYISTVKRHFVRIVPTTMSARRFRLGEGRRGNHGATES